LPGFRIVTTLTDPSVSNASRIEVLAVADQCGSRYFLRLSAGWLLASNSMPHNGFELPDSSVGGSDRGSVTVT
jgi:hypothetical protein